MKMKKKTVITHESHEVWIIRQDESTNQAPATNVSPDESESVRGELVSEEPADPDSSSKRINTDTEKSD